MTDPLRIAMVSEHASPLATLGSVDAGGQNIYVAQVARWLARLGHHVDVLTRRDSPLLAGTVDMAPGVRVIHIDAGPREFVPKERLLPYMGEFARAAQRLLRNSRAYDVLHAHFFMSGRVAQRLAETLGLPFVMTFHALGLVRLQHQREADAFPPERLAIERELVRDATRLIAECPQDQSDLEQLYGADPKRVSMIPCGVDPAEFAPVDRAAARAALGLGEGEFVVLQLGRLVPRKGIDNVIRAVARLPRSVPARLVIVGGESDAPDASRTPEIGRLQRLAAECGIADRVVFTGHKARAELRHCYAAADVFTTTPWYEPFGITPLEAMACGTPVVGSAVGGIQHSVADGVTGFLVPPHAPQALADRLAELHANPGLARAMGRAGIARTRSLFTWERVARELAAVYAEVAAKPAWPAAQQPGLARVLSAP
jgi:D-inositol-3-phosphate glycosyltransferase